MMFILLMPLSGWIDETCLSSKEPPALADDFAKAMIVQLLNVLQPSLSIIFSHIFCNQNLKYCQTTHSVEHQSNSHVMVKSYAWWKRTERAKLCGTELGDEKKSVFIGNANPNTVHNIIIIFSSSC